MRARIFAEQLYAQAEGIWFTEATPSKLKNDNIAVVNAATTPAEPVSPKTVQHTALGLVAGGMLGVFWISAASWWRNSEEEAKPL